jgi:hypothetical protein
VALKHIYRHYGTEWLFLQAQQSCDSNRACVECAENLASSGTDCSSLNCSVVSIETVEMEEYFINGEFVVAINEERMLC